MKKLLATALIFFISTLSAYSSEINFIDVDESNKDYKSIDLIVNYGIMSGYSDNTFRGDEIIDRYAYSVIMHNTLELLNKKMKEIEQKELMDISQPIGSELAKYVNIPDLSKNHWAYKQTLALLKLELIGTYRDGTFGGDKDVNYAGFTIGLGKLMNIIDESAPPVLKRKWIKEKNVSVKVSERISDKNLEFFKLAVENNLIDYKPNNLSHTVTRYEVANYLIRLINKMDELRKYIVFTRIG